MTNTTNQDDHTTLKDVSEPREFWIFQKTSHFGAHEVYESEPFEGKWKSKYTHVIEYSAYQALVDKNHKLEKELATLQDDCSHCSKDYQDVAAKMFEAYEFIAEIAPSWLPENLRMKRRDLLKDYKSSSYQPESGGE